MSEYYHYPYRTKQAYDNYMKYHRLYHQVHSKELAKRTADYRSQHHSQYLYQQYRANARRYLSIADLKDLAQAMDWIREARKEHK